MKRCELCTNDNTVAARVYCESDEASLCFDCDAKVHGANFLVARHSRILLCRSCQSPTPWKAEGRRLGPTVSVCDRCLGARSKKSEDGDDDDQDQESAEDDNDEDEDESEEEEEEEDDEAGEEEEEQVVPGTMGVSPSPPPAISSSSEEEEATSTMGRSNGVGNGLFLKRGRQNVLLDLPYYSTISSQEQLPCCSTSMSWYLPNRTVADDEVTSDSFRPLKDRKRSDIIRSGSH